MAFANSKTMNHTNILLLISKMKWELPSLWCSWGGKQIIDVQHINLLPEAKHGNQHPAPPPLPQPPGQGHAIMYMNKGLKNNNWHTCNSGRSNVQVSELQEYPAAAEDQHVNLNEKETVLMPPSELMI